MDYLYVLRINYMAGKREGDSMAENGGLLSFKVDKTIRDILARSEKRMWKQRFLPM